MSLDHLLHVIEQQLTRTLLVLHHTRNNCMVQVDYPPQCKVRLIPPLTGLQNQGLSSCITPPFHAPCQAAATGVSVARRPSAAPLCPWPAARR